MKPTADLFVLCDHASISQEQKLSIIGIFDNFFVANLPTNWPKMFLVAQISGKPDEAHDLTLKLIPPRGEKIDFPDRNFNIKIGPNGKSNILTQLINFPLTAVGTHKIKLMHSQEEIAGLEYKVTKTTATYEQDLQSKKISN